MKRSKIFLGVTTCLLTIAGVAATRANFGNVKACYWTGVSQGVGTSVKLRGISQCNTAQAGRLICTYTVATTKYRLFTAVNCVKPLFFTNP
jgi:hypothetical protein